MADDAVLPSVSVVVPVHNGGAGLLALAAALRQQDYPPARFELIVGDDASNDGAVEELQGLFARLRTVRVARAGSYAARNAAAALSRADLLVFTDADCEPQPQWLRRGVDALQHAGAALAAGAVEVVTSGHPTLAEQYDQALGLRQEHYARHAGFGATANLFVRRAAFEEVGGFDASLRSAGDQDLCRRMAARGHALVYADAARVRHPARQTVAALATKTVRVARGRAIAFPAARYYAPRILSGYPQLLFDRAAVRPGRGNALRFHALHYLLEALRIAAYACTRVRRLGPLRRGPVP